jgi:hypothetical protein
MISAFEFDNATDAHDGMCDKLVFGETPGVDYDWTHGTEVGLHNVIIGCRSFDYNVNLKQFWMPASRWTMMVRQYIDPGALEDCLAKVDDRLKGRGRGIATLRTRLVQGKGTGRGVRRRWGSCMLNLSFRSNPIPTVSLNSRTTYFGYLAAMDIGVAHAFARACGDIVNIHPGDMEFVWKLDLAQFHGFRSLAWCLMDEEIRHTMDGDVDDRLSLSARMMPGNQPGYRKALDGYSRILKSDRAGTLYGDESFSSFARVRRRFHTEAFGEEYAAQFAGGTRNKGGKQGFPPLPDVWTADLDLATPLSGRPSDGEEDWDDDDEE